MAPVIASTVVNRPAAEVFAYATDPARFREWQQLDALARWLALDQVVISQTVG